MISTLCFSLAALGLAALFTLRLRKSGRAGRKIDTYYVCDVESLPTWKRKAAPKARAADRVG